MRLHGPTKATTLGVGCLLIASSVFFSSLDNGISLHEVLITLFLFITAPISAHLLAKAALHLDLHSYAKLPDSKTNEHKMIEKAIDPTLAQKESTAEKAAPAPKSNT